MKEAAVGPPGVIPIQHADGAADAGARPSSAACAPSVSHDVARAHLRLQPSNAALPPW